ncbi:nucleotide pyrophosphohydrolase [Bifidobacterium crudilactis]|jgi:NTP pyrophosphatase (non-canonical NTP hydrolase)|uniref:nucleotide pyrophosphohydrolase n=1 Tax=Bifidobacterium crudilactis TaxID=327277 RepID=UPI0023567B58|nr:nucleotide pyrophosphohydrolase [Bifidobacterium crudilactis]MCI2148858.1 nucleotide pyrophosphohydrolase [Bifidobacterium crudilactis]MCI2158276.1 nucleotide pyrophosphohydrolase [Bifidobacterium crudilactis]
MLSDSTINLITQFSAERDWSKFHTSENLAKSICIEASELLECYQWGPEARNNDTEHVHEELADVLIYCVMMADKLNCDLDDIIMDKLGKNRLKYPIAKSYGNSEKYRDL